MTDRYIGFPPIQLIFLEQVPVYGLVALGLGWGGVAWEGQGGGGEAGSLTWVGLGAPLGLETLSELAGCQWSWQGRGAPANFNLGQ